jgi:hypothetical protein
MRLLSSYFLYLCISVVTVVGRTESAAADGSIDLIEHTTGATNINSVTGHGGMAVGLSADGDVTTLLWPNASLSDQLGYITSNAFDARARPRMGAPEGSGIFLGLLIETTQGQRTAYWLRDRSLFTITQDYADDGPNPRTRYEAEALGLIAEVTDAISPTSSVLVRHVVIQMSPTSSIRRAWLLTYANLSPTPPNSRVPKLPVVDWAMDGRNDFAALWDADATAVLHFHPRDQLIYDTTFRLFAPREALFGPLGDLLSRGAITAEETAALVARLDQDYAPGAYLLLSTRPAPDQHQLGYDATPFCDVVDELVANLQALPDRIEGFQSPVDPKQMELLRCRDRTPAFVARGWKHAARDALDDVKDGELEGSPVAAGEVNEALRTPLVLVRLGDGTSTAAASVILGAGATLAEARAATAGTEPGEVAAAAEEAVRTWLRGRRLPTKGSDRLRAVARRALINIRAGTVAENSAIVASLARQPSYGFDWPRDGAFFNLLHDVSGQAEVVSRRAALYSAWQRKEEDAPELLVDLPPPLNPDGRNRDSYPRFMWEMNYYADGAPGGLFRFEIDNSALTVWSLVAHAGWIPERAESYLREHWEMIASAANFLAEWRDPDNGLQAPAQEDDNAHYTQTLHGAITVYGALEMAARGARFLGETSLAAAWERRAGELREALLTHFYDSEQQHFIAPPTHLFPGAVHTGPTAWLVWPMQLLPFDDARMRSQVARDLDAITPIVQLARDGGIYFLKNTLAAAMFAHAVGDAAVLDRVATLLEHIAALSTPGTNHFGEATVTVQTAQGAMPSQRVATPHLWEGALFYLSAMALEDASLLQRHDEILPVAQIPGRGREEGCACKVGRGGAASSGSAWLLLLLWPLWRRSPPRKRSRIKSLIQMAISS